MTAAILQVHLYRGSYRYALTTFWGDHETIIAKRTRPA